MSSKPNEDLGGDLLASVSRSFYLSIRFLPQPLREPIGLAYLLARASDTIADSAAEEGPTRARWLGEFGTMVETLNTRTLHELQGAIHPQSSSEQRLISQLPAIFEWLGKIDTAARAEIREVLKPIVRGQMLDLQRFLAGSAAVPVALESKEELEEYTYLVAGCVGEFWTRISLQRLGTEYSKMETSALTTLGRNFGKGLQLVNILRDLPADLREGRCYLPIDELQQAGLSTASLVHDPSKVRPIYRRWVERAEELLGEGRRYIAAVRPGRVRLACYLPWYLGRATLDLLKTTSPLETPERLKVPRRKVYAGLVRGMALAFSGAR